MRAAIIVSVLALSACESCDQKFAPGEFVKKRLDGSRALVIRSSDITNFEGYCLVTVRTEADNLEHRAAEELERL